MRKIIIALSFLVIFFVGCSENKDCCSDLPTSSPRNFTYLALGDSYTIGESVCQTCRFPEQLKSAFVPVNAIIDITLIAQTGWTTTNLKSAIAAQNPSNNFDLVTLLIGVNNQYQNKPFSLYETEFPELVAIAITKAKGKKENVIVVSIPDYAYTPFGQSTGANNQANISSQIDAYNVFAQNYCQTNNISFVNITDITRQGLSNPTLVASDGLHPSQMAYQQFIDRILPIAKVKLGL